jgi:hypothetical protein
MDEDTIQSEITNDSFDEIDKSEWDKVISDKKEVLLKSLYKLGIESLKNKCKESNIITKMNKKESMIEDMMKTFDQICQILQKMLKKDLKIMAKSYNLKISGKKDMIIYSIVDHHIDKLIFTLDEKKTIVIDVNQKISDKTSLENEKQKIMEELKKLDVEIKKEEERIAQEKRLHEEKLEEERITQEKRLHEEKLEEERIAQEKEQKKKKQIIPKNVRTIIWNLYIGDDIIKHKCLCCKKVTISNTGFEVGHVISEKDGGTQEVNNLRPICGACNNSMGTMNMRDYVLKYGLLI